MLSKGFYRLMILLNNYIFLKDKEKYEQSKEWVWMYIRLIDVVDTLYLSLHQLRDHSLKGISKAL